MKISKCIIIGFGTIGKRHAKNFLNLKCEVFVWSRSIQRNQKINKTNKINKIKFTNNLDETIENVDFAVICTNTSTHLKYILKCLDFKKNIYLEKPITNKINEIKKITNHKNFKKVKIQVGCQLRSDPQILKIKKIISKKILGKIITYKSYVGQNLNLWREKEAKKYYSAYKKYGGGVYWDLIHDIDLAYYLIGDFNIIKSVSTKLSNITYDADDYCNLIIKHKTKKILGNIILDMINPAYTRNLLIILDKGSISWEDNLREIKITKYNKKKNKIIKIKDNIKRNDIFIKHAENFISAQNKNIKLICDFNDFKTVNCKLSNISKI